MLLILEDIQEELFKLEILGENLNGKENFLMTPIYGLMKTDKN